MRRFSYVPSIEDGLLQCALASGNGVILRYMMQRLPIELVGNPFYPFKFDKLPASTHWICLEQKLLYECQMESAFDHACRSSRRIVELLICECVKRIQDSQKIPYGPAGWISYSLPRQETFWLFKFYLSWEFQKTQTRYWGGNDELPLRTVLEEAADIHPDTLFDCDFWFAYKEPVCLLSAGELVDSGCPYQPQMDLFSAWHFTRAPEMLDYLFKFLLDHNVDLCMCGCPGHKMTNRFTRMASMNKVKSAHPGFPSAIQFASLYLQNETLFRTIVRQYGCAIGTPAACYVERRLPSLLHCAILANSPMRVRVLLEEGCPSQLNEILVMFENDCNHPSSGIVREPFINIEFFHHLVNYQCGVQSRNFVFYEN